MILFCKVYSRSMELNYFWVGLQTKNDQFWKFIDTNEKYFHNFTIMQYGFPFLMNIILDYLGHLKNYNKIKAVQISTSN